MISLMIISNQLTQVTMIPFNSKQVNVILGVFAGAILIALKKDFKYEEEVLYSMKFLFSAVILPPVLFEK